MTFYENEESNQSIPLTTTHDGSQGDESMYDYIAGYNDDNDENLSLFDFEESQLMVDPDNNSNIAYYDEFDQDFDQESFDQESFFDDGLTQQSQESQIQINFDDFPISAPPSPTPKSVKSPTPQTNTKNMPNDNNTQTNTDSNNTNTLTIPTQIINDNMNKLVERQHHYHLAVVAASPQLSTEKKTPDIAPLTLSSNLNPINLNNNHLNSGTYHHYHNNNHHQNNYNSNYMTQNWQKSMWKSHGGARRFFMPLPNRRFTLMHHHEIEQVLRKQLSHMMLPDPLKADFYCGTTQAREGKSWEGFGVPGLNHVYIKKSHKYPRNNDGSPILPPGTLGKTAGFVSVHAPKSMISFRQQIAKSHSESKPKQHEIDFHKFDELVLFNSDKIDFECIGDGDLRDYASGVYVDKELSLQIEIGFDLCGSFERCNMSVFYVHQESECRMLYNTANGLINSRSQRDDMNTFNICLRSRDQTMKNLINFMDLLYPNNTFYKLLSIDKGRKLIYRIFMLFEADNLVFIAMLKLLCAKIYLFATIQQGKKISAQDIEFADKLISVLNPKEYHHHHNNYHNLYTQYIHKKKQLQCIQKQSVSDDQETNDDNSEKKKEKLSQELVAMENQLHYLKELIPPRLSSVNVLIIFKLIIKNIESFTHLSDRKLLFKSRLVCSILSVCVKVSKPNQEEWIQCFNKLFNLLGNDLTFIVPGLTRLQSAQSQPPQSDLSEPQCTNNNNPFCDSVIIPSVMNEAELERLYNPNVHERGNVFLGAEYYKLTGKNLTQWSVLMASPRIRWELICDICIGCDENTSAKIYDLKNFWQAVKEGMFYYPPARFLAHNHSQLKRELYGYFDKIKEKARVQMAALKKSQSQSQSHSHSQDESKEETENVTVSPIKRAQSDPLTSINMNININGNNNPISINNPHPYSHPQSMHHYVHQMRGWLAAFERNELKQLEKERQHRINMEKQSKRQREYEKMLQQKKDAQNERFKQQFFKQLKEKGINKESEQISETNVESVQVAHIAMPSRKKTMDTKLANIAQSATETVVEAVPVEKDKVVINSTTPSLETDFKFVFEINNIKNEMQAKGNKFVLKKIEIEDETLNLNETDDLNINMNINDNISSCSSSDNGSFVSLGIGVDPFALNNRYYQNIINTNSNTEKEEKNTEFALPQKSVIVKKAEEKQRKMAETAMMLAHGMQEIGVTQRNESRINNHNYNNNNNVIRHGHNNNNNAQNEESHVISPGVHVNRSRNRYYGHNHHYYDYNYQTQMSRRREHYQYNRYNRRDRDRNKKYREEYSLSAAKKYKIYNGYYDASSSHADDYYAANRNVNGIPPRMRGSNGMLSSLGIREKHKKNREKYSKYRDKYSKKRENNINSLSYNKGKSNRNKNSLYYDDRAHLSERGRDVRDRYRTRDNHTNASRYYQYKSSPYSSNSKYNYSRKTRR